MAQAPTYTRKTGFADDERTNAGGRTTVRADRLDAELDAASQSINGLRANQVLIQRDDGALRDRVVTPAALTPAAIAMFTAARATPRGVWAAGIVYAVNDLAERNGAGFLALAAHTSTDFTADRAAGRWQAFPGTPSATDTAFTPGAAVSATNTQAAIEEVAAALSAGRAGAAFNFGAF